MPVPLKNFLFFKVMFVKSVQCARRPAEGIVFQEPELQVFVLSWRCVLGCLSSPFI